MPAYEIRNAQYALLTYPQCGDLDPFRIVDAAASVGAECIVARELHADGGNHLHAFIDFGRRYTTRRADVFDVDGRHPNIQSRLRDPVAGYDYVIKDGDVVAGGAERPEAKQNAVDKRQDNWHAICNATSRDEFFELVREHFPERLVTGWNNILAYANHHFPLVPEPSQPVSGFDFDTSRYPELDRWAQCIIDWDASLGRGKSLVLYGDTLTGKTQWARSLGPHCYHNGQFNPQIHSGHARYAIFDDLKGGFKCWPSFKQWLGQQREFTITGKYLPLTTITWGKPCIYISNTDPRMEVENSQDLDWLEGNCVFVHIEAPLF
ncbi:replication associated protein [Chicken genomovirus mg4_1218]|uniref:Replication-associated protein n=1 Tax=Chicken genomovirus mg4_1218 TaxID=2720945 RepID=A0A6G9W4M0_9VIRU|nr:replication associated protein [Chicken genomovirus mg4_1218]QIR82241.1 replication associated protein [Chicken genomovirus mg4_1218]